MAEEDEQDQFDYENRVPATIAQVKADADLTRWQLTPEIDPFRHGLRGEYWDYEKNTWINNECRLMNDIGIETIIAFVIEHKTDKNVLLSNLDLPTINALMRDLDFAVRDMLTANMKKWEIKKENLSIIYYRITDAVYFSFLRAKEQGERKFIKGITQRVEQMITRKEPDKKKGWHIFGGGER